MAKKNRRHAKYPERNLGRSGKYSTNTKAVARVERDGSKQKSSKAPLFIALSIIVVLITGGLLAFFNWDKIIDLTTTKVTEVMNESTTIPTSRPTPSPTPAPTAKIKATQSPSPVPSPTPREDIVKVKISVVGDMSFYQTQLEDAHNATDDTYDFSHNFEPVADILRSADLLIGSLNTTLSGTDLGYSGAPDFNTPESILGTLKDVGFDVLVTGNSEIFDYGWVGVEKTNYFIKNAGIKTTGTYMSEEEYYKPLIVDANGIKIAILSYCDNIDNEEDIPKNQLGYGIKSLKVSSAQRDIKACKDAGADIIFAYVNWGDENDLIPTSDNKSTAQKLLDSGIDAIFGTHPQAIQYITRKNVKQADGKNEQAIVAYSLGNFLTSSRTVGRDSSMILSLIYEQNNTLGTVELIDVNYQPTWICMKETDDVKKNYQILPIAQYLDDSQLFNSLSDLAKERLPKVWEEITNVIGTSSASPLR